MKRTEFIAALFVLGLAGLLVGGINLYEIVNFRLDGQEAVMELADPEKRSLLTSGEYGAQVLDVKYVSQNGELIVPQKRLLGHVAQKLVSGAQVPIIYLKQDPHRVIYSKNELDSPWIWLLVGVGAMVAFVVGVRLRRKENG